MGISRLTILVSAFMVLAFDEGSLVLANGHDYFALKSASGGCIARQQDGSDELFLKACNPGDDTIYWRLDDMNRFHSKVNDAECIQVGQRPEIDEGVAGLQSGTRVYVKTCVTGGLKRHFQWFDSTWRADGGPLYLAERPDLCVIHFSADTAVLGESRIMVKECAALGGGRAKGWEALYMDYFTLDSPSGGCIARKTDGSDELFLKKCTSYDDNIQWRLDSHGRFRSKVNDDECMQAGQSPVIQQGVGALESGTHMYVKTCADGMKKDFQVMSDTFIEVGGLSGPLSLAMRPDLCVVHFGADPTIGESRIQLLECDTLGGDRALGWEADNPCTHEPVCFELYSN